MKNRVAVRIEANFTTGMGHMVRCLAITNSLPKDKYEVFYFISIDSQVVKDTLEKYSVKVITLPVCYDEQEDGGWIRNYCTENKIMFSFFISDNYNLSSKWENIIASVSNTVIAIDDLANRQHNVNYLIDTGLGRREQDYLDLCAEPVSMLLGEKFAILRPEFCLKRILSINNRLKTKSLNSLLISFGATDPHNDSLKVLNIIESLGFIGTVNVLTTSLNENLAELEAKVLKNKKVFLHVDSQLVADIIHDSDLAIGALGSSAIERIFLGLPSVCIVTEKNQEFNGKQLSEKEVIKLSQADLIEQTLRSCLKPSFMDEWAQMSKNCLSLYDELGIFRILSQVFNVSQEIELIDMTKDHCLELFNWQTEPGNRKYSRSEIPPTWDEHVNWFHNALNDVQRNMWIIQFNGQNSGYVRLDQMKCQEEVSILISQKYRRLGIGYLALQAIKEKSKFSNILATVHQENIASIDLFTGAGFLKKSENTYAWIKK